MNTPGKKGERNTKEEYSWKTYKYSNDSYDKLTKYCTERRYGDVDEKIKLLPRDDAAFVYWGGKWRMPTLEEQQELVDNCIWKWTTLKGVAGYKIIGSNGNFIFLPATGLVDKNILYNEGVGGFYWSSSLYLKHSSQAHFMGFDSLNNDCGYFYRYYGWSIRAVCE